VHAGFNLAGCLYIHGAFVQAHLKNEWSNLNAVAMREMAFPNDPAAVDKRPISAAEIAEMDGVVGDAENTVLTADPRTVRSDMAFGAAANDELPTGKL